MGAILSVVLITSIVWYIAMRVAKIPYDNLIILAMIFVDIIIANVLLGRLIYFFSQFVLPIQNPKYRQEIYSRVKNFETDSKRGPAMFIKNGRVIMHAGEADKHGPGVIVLDTASAAVLRTDTEIKDTVGPGVKFTSGKEYIVGNVGVDLRSQWQSVGPHAGDRPFYHPVPIPAPKEYNEAQNRRKQTSGLTRDGFEVAPRISIKFRIKRPVEKKPTESGVTSQYGYDADSVHNAITREVIQPGAMEKNGARMEWAKFPEHLVVNIWREYIRKFKLGDLFAGEPSGLQTIEAIINKRVKQSGVEALSDTGKTTGEWLESLEYKQLQSRGLEINEVRILNVFFDEDMEKQMISQWSADWLNSAQKEEKHLKERETLIETASREEANKIFARIASSQFSAKPTMPQNQFKTLQLLIQPLRLYLLNESSSNSERETELRKLDEIWKWLLDNSSNTDATLRNAPGGGKP